MGEQKANSMTYDRDPSEAKKIRNSSRRTRTRRISEPLLGRTPAERSYRNSMRCSVAVFLAGLSWNCAALLPPGGRAWLSLCLRRPRNVSRRARSLMSPILLTRCPSRLRAWNFRGCFGFDAEKPGTEDRISKRLRTLLEWARETGKTRGLGAETQEANANTWLAASA